MSTRTIIVCLEDVGRDQLKVSVTPRLDDILAKGRQFTYWSQPTSHQTFTAVVTGQYGLRTLAGGGHSTKGNPKPGLVYLPPGLNSIHGHWPLGCAPDALAFNRIDLSADTAEICTSVVEAMKDGYEQVFVNYPPLDLEVFDPLFGQLIEASMQLGYRMLVYTGSSCGRALGGGNGSLHEEGVSGTCSAYGWGELPPNMLLSATDVLTLVDGRIRKDSCSIGRRSYLYAEKFSPNGHKPDEDDWSWALRDTRWKLIRTSPTHNMGLEKLELFDLELDPGEEQNLMADQPIEAARLIAEAARIHAS